MTVTNTNDSLRPLLEQFIRLFQEMEQTEANKAQAAETFDIELMDQCMKEEQAFILQMKGYERKRQTLLKNFSIPADTHLNNLFPLLPRPAQEQTEQTFLDLKASYDSFYAVYQKAAELLKKNGSIVSDELSRLQKLQEQTTGRFYSPDGTPVKTQTRSIKNIHI